MEEEETYVYSKPNLGTIHENMKDEDIRSIIKRYRIVENDINFEGIYYKELKDIKNAYDDLRNHRLKLRIVSAAHVYNLLKEYFDEQKLKTMDSGLYKKEEVKIIERIKERVESLKEEKVRIKN